MESKPTQKSPSLSSSTSSSSDNLQLIAIAFENGFFIALSPKESLKLGTMSLCLPSAPFSGGRENLNLSAVVSQQTKLPRKKLTTATVLGARNELFAKALAEKVTRATAKMVYLSVNFEEDNSALFTEAMQLLEEWLEEVIPKKSL